MQTDDIFYQQLIKQDWTDHNLSVLKRCLEQTDEAILNQTNRATFPFLNTPHFPTVFGISRWAVLDYFLEAATQNLFEEITARWIEYQGAAILELHGKNTILTAKHVVDRNEKLADSENGYRKNNQVKNQKNQLLLKEITEPNSEDTKPNIVLLHGHGFAYLRIYLEKSDVPELTTNIMLMSNLDAASENEFVADPKPEMRPQKVVSETVTEPEVSLKKNKDDDSQS